MASENERVEELLRRLAGEKFLRLGGEELEALLAAARQLREEDTGMTGKIRLLEYQGRYLVQEFTDCGEVRLRRFDDRPGAERFIEERLETYDRMWDGCGCKVDYDE